ncbi:MAG: acetyl-CoA carboxylase biotin carboxylase subunit [Thermoanaerobaculum sp.]|nr:acetyl-CoA carboxylase biotin carboxylase subunit [Thermoanaerobaculum sp.]
MRVLIANRGEIALRLIRACHELGWEAVAVYSEVDAQQPYVLAADAAVLLGPPAPRASYLNIPRLVEVATSTGCRAVHPGYGFLAENAAFARAVQEAGLVWMGPPPEVIELLGSKTAARELAVQVGVPVTPGTPPLAHVEQAQAFARQVGYPILLKAVGGGGGKGMRAVATDEELADAFARAQAEGLAFFADGRVYAEKLIQRPRHVEVQILADRQGRVVHLGERECSIQRRHQKLVEESPSPAVTPELRERLGKAAVAVAQAAGYVTAGTVEFLLAPDGSFYFLEVNTRLQVEHPVTELVYGVDLVQWMMRLALGEPLTLTQEALVPRGHAVECRVYAEDPQRDFAPSPGRVQVYREPAGPGVRVDSGVEEGCVVPLDYDPILAKLIVWGEDRRQSLARLRRALTEYVILGVHTTLPLFQRLCQDPDFLAGNVHTGFLQEFLAQPRVAAEPEAVALAAALAMSGAASPREKPVPDGEETNSWRLLGRQRLLHRWLP